MNLIRPSYRRKRSRWGKAHTLAVLGLALVVFAYRLMPETSEVARVLEVEEREVVVSVLTDLGVDEFTEQFVNNGIPAFVEFAGKTLVRNEDAILYFSPQFFLTDSITQRQALRSAIGTTESSASVVLRQRSK